MTSIAKDDRSQEAREDNQPKPDGELTLRLIPTRSDANLHGDISGGWLVEKMDHAAESVVSQIAKGRIANIAMESLAFMSPIRIGAAVCIYTNLLDIGTSSVRIGLEVWTKNPQETQSRKVADAVFVYVAIDESGRIRKVPR